MKLDKLNESRYAVLEQAKQEKRNAEILARQLGLSTDAFYTENLKPYYEGRFHALTAPCVGKRHRSFGSYIDKKFNTQHFNNGWSIEIQKTVSGPRSEKRQGHLQRLVSRLRTTNHLTALHAISYDLCEPRRPVRFRRHNGRKQ